MTSRPRTRAQNAQRLQRSVGALSTMALARMDTDMPWVANLPAQERSWLGMIVQAGVKAFVDWYRDPTSVNPLAAEVFGAAPPALTREITLQQTVALIRLSIEVVEENVTEVVGEVDAIAVRAAIDSYAREVAFATAEVYARAAEQRGAWDARLEALVVDAVLRGDADEVITSRASALGWDGRGHVVVVAGELRDDASIDSVRRFAHDRHLDALCAVQGERLVVLLGGVDALGRPAGLLAETFGPGPVVIGPVVDSLAQATMSAEGAQAGLRAVTGWQQAPRPVLADDLLAERALLGDAGARNRLVEDYVVPLEGDLRSTVEAYLDEGGSMEATSRSLFVHANTVRYRLKRVAELTGLSPTDPRDAFTLRVALVLARLLPPLL